VEQKIPARARFAIAFHMTIIKISAHIVLRIVGKDTSGILRAMFGQTEQTLAELRPGAISNGKAREFSQVEAQLKEFGSMIRPDSGWIHHEDQWGPHRVMVLPRVIDSNTGVVIGPEDNPDRGGVVTNDGQPPNCDPPALNFILHGPAPPASPATDSAESGTSEASTTTQARSNKKEDA
jgi:hypothetical protein